MRFRRVRLIVFFFLCLSTLRGEEVVVASYNVRNYLLMERRIGGKSKPEQPKPEKEIEAVIRVISKIKPDILGIIEMGDERQFADFRQRLAKAGLRYEHREWVPGMGDRRHVCLLSRFPIVERNSRSEIPLKMNKKVEWMNRGILDVTVEITPSYRLRLLGAHLKSRREALDYDEKWKRAKEAWHLRQHIDAILAAEQSVNLLLFGDLNDTKNEYPIREIIGTPGTAAHMKDLQLRDDRGETWTHYWSVADTYSRIDYLMVSPGLRKEIIPRKCGIDSSPYWYTGSDHRAIYATISPTDQ